MKNMNQIFEKLVHNIGRNHSRWEKWEWEKHHHRVHAKEGKKT